MDWPLTPTYWIVMGLVLLTLEVITPGFVIFFFGLGALAVGILTLFVHVSEPIQLGLFAGLSLLSLMLLRRFARSIFGGKPSPVANGLADDYVGQAATVRELVAPKRPGKVELHGSDWQAESDEELPPGTAVTVVSRDGLTLRVRRR